MGIEHRQWYFVQKNKLGGLFWITSHWKDRILIWQLFNDLVASWILNFVSSDICPSILNAKKSNLKINLDLC